MAVNINRLEDSEEIWSTTPLYVKSLVKPIVDEDLDVNCFVLGRSTPLFLASLERDIALVRLLLDRGAEVNQQCHGGETPLYAASEVGEHDIVQTLLDRGADVNLPTDSENTCLNIACQRGHFKVIRILLENGADTSRLSQTDTESLLAALNIHYEPEDSENYLERTPSRDTVLRNHIERTIDVIIEETEVELPLNTLHDACAKGHLNDVHIFLDRGVDVNHPSGNGQTPLYIACMNNQFSIVEVLFERGAQPDRQNIIGSVLKPSISPLYIAAKKGFTDMVRLMLENGAEVDKEVSQDGQSPLHIACMKGHYDIVQLLLNGGADINKTFKLAHNEVSIFDLGYEKILFTPIKMALLGNHIQVVRLLLERGAQMSEGHRYFKSILPSRAMCRHDERRRNRYNISVYRVLQNLPDMLMVFYVEGYFDVVLVMLVEMLKLDSRIFGLGAVLSLAGKAFSLRDFASACKHLDLNSYGKGMLFKPLKLHLKKLQIVGLFGGTISVDREIVDRYNTEVTSIKAFIVLNDVSLYVVFQRYKYPYYLKNQDLFESLETYLNSPVALEQFPHYIQILKNTLQRSMYRLALLSKVSGALEGQEWWDKLPLLPQEYILSHLDMIDLEKISSSE